MVKIKCSGAGTRKLGELVEFQGDLKSLSKVSYEMFRHQLLDLGLCETITIWPDRNLIANGHQRLRVMQAMQKNGDDVPDDIPVSYVHPESEEEFAKIVLSLCSQYGHIERQGMYEYCTKHNIPVKYVETRLKLPGLNVPRFKMEFFEDVNPDQKKPKLSECPACGHQW